MFLLQVKPDSKPCQAPLRLVVYAFQNPFNGMLEKLQQQDIITPLGVDETEEWCNGFTLVLNQNWKVGLCLDPPWFNQASK